MVEGKEESSARNNLVNEFLDKICLGQIDLFLPHEEKKEAQTLLTITQKSNHLTIQRSVTKGDNIYFLPNQPPFKSLNLTQLIVSLSPSQLKDATSDDARIATDKHQSQAARLAAIRKLRGNKSEDALNAMRYLIFETTDIDLYRYEAVDTLVATGTKQAYQILIERLAQVGRTGFQLRLARAVAGAMKVFFRSDEKTPDSIRMKEVDDLLLAAKKNPPGN